MQNHVCFLYTKTSDNKTAFMLEPTWQKTGLWLQFLQAICCTKWYSKSFWPMDVFSIKKSCSNSVGAFVLAAPTLPARITARSLGCGVLNRERSLEKQVGGAWSWPTAPLLLSTVRPLLLSGTFHVTHPSSWSCSQCVVPGHGLSPHPFVSVMYVNMIS